MPQATKCPGCGRVITYDVPDEIVCECGWSQVEEFERDARFRCEIQGLDYRRLVRELGDDETVDSYLWALEKDD
jgi:hypothetical protein